MTEAGAGATQGHRACQNRVGTTLRRRIRGLLDEYSRAGRPLGLCILLVLAGCTRGPEPSPFQAARHETQDSACGFTLDLGSGFGSPTQGHAEILRSAVQQMRALGSRRVAINVLQLPGDAPDGPAVLTEATRRGLLRLGVEPAQILVRSPAPGTGRRALFLDVCDWHVFERVRTAGPLEPDRTTRFRIGGRTLAIPLRYLHPTYWLNVPFREAERHFLSLGVGWPGLGDLVPPASGACGGDADPGCVHPLGIAILDRSAPGSLHPEPRGSLNPADYVVEWRDGQDFRAACTWLRSIRASPGDRSSATARVPRMPGTCSVQAAWLGSNTIRLSVPDDAYEDRWQIVDGVVALVRSFIVE